MITPDIVRRIRQIQILTVIWMSVEVAVSIFAALRARSPALIAFGGDSAIELLSATVVLWRFRSVAAQERAERQAAHITGALLLSIALFVIAASTTTLLGYNVPKPTLLGIGILVVAAAVMPWLAREKLRLSSATKSAALKADSTQSALCAYLSLTALAGLTLNSVWHMSWADPVAALLLLPIIMREGWNAIRGKPCCDCA